MVVSVEKTECMHVDSDLVQHFSRISVGKADYSDTSLVKTWDHVCPLCGWCGPSQHVLAVHTARWCGESQRKVHEKDFDVENILQTRGSVQRRFYEVQWKGFTERTWEPARHLNTCADVEAFWAESSYSAEMTLLEQAGEQKCHFCNWLGRGIGTSSLTGPEVVPAHQGVKLAARLRLQ